jgi:hypothetical protein
MNIFEIASRKKFRFDSERGAMTTEQLWDLPLTSRTGFDLDSVAKAVSAELKAQSEESFVTTTTNPRKGELEVMLEVVKHVISFKIATAKAAAERVEKAEKRRKIMDAIQAKDEQALTTASKEDLLKQLAELDETVDA